MMSIQNIMKSLAGMIDNKRFQHSVNVMNESEKLANHYGANVSQAILAGLLHDCGKNYSGKSLAEVLNIVGHKPDPIEKLYPKLLHGLAGAYIAQLRFDVDDPDVLSAIRWHTTGKKDMSLLDKIIFVADYIEVTRDFPEVGMLREAAWRDLDEAVLLCSDVTIRHILNKGGLIHPRTLDTRNEMIIQKMLR